MQSPTGVPAVVLGSAFSQSLAANVAAQLEPLRIHTPLGPVLLHRHLPTGGVVLFRHGHPHRYLPHQIPWRAHARALSELGVTALLLTSSVGVLDPDIPPFVPHLAGDLLMLDNRLPDGSVCTIWPQPAADQAHLVVDDGLFNSALSDWIVQRFSLPERRLLFAYVPGPRTKTAAENHLLRSLGAQVNSMSIGPEVVLANELGIPTAAVLTGHKASARGAPSPTGITESLDRAQRSTLQVCLDFLAEAPTVAFGNHLYRFGAGT